MDRGKTNKLLKENVGNVIVDNGHSLFGINDHFGQEAITTIKYLI